MKQENTHNLSFYKNPENIKTTYPFNRILQSFNKSKVDIT